MNREQKQQLYKKVMLSSRRSPRSRFEKNFLSQKRDTDISKSQQKTATGIQMFTEKENDASQNMNKSQNGIKYRISKSPKAIMYSSISGAISKMIRSNRNSLENNDKKDKKYNSKIMISRPSNSSFSDKIRLSNTEKNVEKSNYSDNRSSLESSYRINSKKHKELKVLDIEQAKNLQNLKIIFNPCESNPFKYSMSDKGTNNFINEPIFINFGSIEDTISNKRFSSILEITFISYIFDYLTERNKNSFDELNALIDVLCPKEDARLINFMEDIQTSITSKIDPPYSRIYGTINKINSSPGLRSSCLKLILKIMTAPHKFPKLSLFKNIAKNIKDIITSLKSLSSMDAILIQNLLSYLTMFVKMTSHNFGFWTISPYNSLIDMNNDHEKDDYQMIFILDLRNGSLFLSSGFYIDRVINFECEVPSMLVDSQLSENQLIKNSENLSILNRPSELPISHRTSLQQPFSDVTSRYLNTQQNFKQSNLQVCRPSMPHLQQNSPVFKDEFENSQKPEEEDKNERITKRRISLISSRNNSINNIENNEDLSNINNQSDTQRKNCYALQVRNLITKVQDIKTPEHAQNKMNTQNIKLSDQNLPFQIVRRQENNSSTSSIQYHKKMGLMLKSRKHSLAQLSDRENNSMSSQRSVRTNLKNISALSARDPTPELNRTPTYTPRNQSFLQSNNNPLFNHRTSSMTRQRYCRGQKMNQMSELNDEYLLMGQKKRKMVKNESFSNRMQPQRQINNSSLLLRNNTLSNVNNSVSPKPQISNSPRISTCRRPTLKSRSYNNSIEQMRSHSLQSINFTKLREVVDSKYNKEPLFKQEILQVINKNLGKVSKEINNLKSMDGFPKKRNVVNNVIQNNIMVNNHIQTPQVQYSTEKLSLSQNKIPIKTIIPPKGLIKDQIIDVFEDMDLFLDNSRKNDKYLRNLMLTVN